MAFRFTVAHNRTLYQIQDNLRAQRVTVEAWLDGPLRITHQGRRLQYREIAARPAKVVALPKVRLDPHPVKPAPDPPWRNPFILRKKKEAGAAIP